MASWLPLPNVGTPGCAADEGLHLGRSDPRPNAQRIKGVYRVATVTTSSLSRSGTDSSFTVLITEPLALIVDDSAIRRSNCFHSVAFFVDASEVERSIVTRDLLLSNPQWPHRFREAIMNNSVIVGMSREMVVALVGYPSKFGSVRELNHLDTWTYGQNNTYKSTVYFKHNRVIRFQPAGHNP